MSTENTNQHDIKPGMLLHKKQLKAVLKRKKEGKFMQGLCVCMYYVRFDAYNKIIKSNTQLILICSLNKVFLKFYMFLVILLYALFMKIVM